MAEQLAQELREQIPEQHRAEVLKQVEMLLVMGITPAALQIAVQLPTCARLARAIIGLI